jgi:hypothetical protein
VNRFMASPVQLKPSTAAPYVPLKSLLTALDYLQQGVPTILDRSVWPTLSGGLGTQLLAAFRFLGLINDDHETMPLLHRAVDQDSRKDAIGEAVRQGYKDLIEMDLSRATPKQLSDYLADLYSVSGSTHKKAMTFFLHAAKYVELPLSPAITRGTRASSQRRKRSAAPPEKQDFDESHKEILPPSDRDTKGSARTIELRGGGSATLTFDVDVWSMTPEDQQFVFEMIRKLTEYEHAENPRG